MKPVSENTKKSSLIWNKFSPVLKFVLSGLLIFSGVLLVLPEAGALRTLPFLPMLAIAANFFYDDVKINCGFAVLFSFVMYCVQGVAIWKCAVIALLCALICLVSVYGAKLVILAVKMKKSKYSIKRQLVKLVLCAAVCCVLSVLCFGNAYGYFSHDKQNKAYVNNHYSEQADVKFTYFDAFDFEYKTVVSFEDESVKYGDDNDFCISRKNGKITDNVRDYCEEKMLEKSVKKLKASLNRATPNPASYEVSNCFVKFEKNEVLAFDADGDNYLDRTVFVVSFYDFVNNKSDFDKLCTGYMEKLSENEDFTFNEILFLGGNAESLLYTAVVSPKTNINNIAAEIKDFDKDFVKGYGITEKTYLDYWQNTAV